MPPYVQVSIFRIHCQEMVEKLAGKFSDTAKQLELLITKKAKKLTKALQDKFEEIKKKIIEKPDDV